jgi:hypothetical protein
VKLRFLVRNHLDFQPCALRQIFHSKRRPCGWIRREIFGINLVHRRKIIDVGEKYLSQGASLADLYGENLDLLFTDLAEAHRELDVIVLGLYGLSKDASEAEMVGRLFEMINPL